MTSTFSPIVLPILEGFIVALSLIVAFGPQNLFVLRQGVRREGIFIVALVSSLLDFGLIALGAGGLGHLVDQTLFLANLVAWGGATFLMVYGSLSLRAALKPGHPKLPSKSLPIDAASSSRTILVATVAVSLLNPHAFLDTVVLIGGNAARYPNPDRTLFASGAMLASAVWFFGLAYGAARFAPALSRQRVLRGIDGASGVLMWLIAVRLAYHAAVG